MGLSGEVLFAGGRGDGEMLLQPKSGGVVVGTGGSGTRYQLTDEDDSTRPIVGQFLRMGDGYSLRC